MREVRLIFLMLGKRVYTDVGGTRRGVGVGQAEDSAREAGRGIWSGSFQEPAAWRRDNKRGGTTSVAAAPASHALGCDIKGNINSKGDKIYHVPGGEYYAATKIDVGSDERWFCDEAEATAAGWRKARG